MINLKKTIFITLLSVYFIHTQAQTVLTLDSCRAMALKNNNEIKIADEKIKAAQYERKAAQTNYLPNLKAMGSYIRNEKEFSLLNSDQKKTLNNFGTTTQQSLQQIIQSSPELGQLLAPLAGMDIAAPLNGIGQSLTDALHTDTRNVYVGAVMLLQPVYMGGKIKAYNKITHFAEQIAINQQDGDIQNVVLNTDQAYWQVVSLANKQRLAKSYLELVQKLENDVEKMINEGIATKADGLSVMVKVNEAEMTLMQVENGLSLSRMVLCQLCGLDITSDIRCADEESIDLSVIKSQPQAEVETAIQHRPEIKNLQLAENIYHQKTNITRSEFLPSIALNGNYIVSNPSVFNGYEKEFHGMWNVGVVVSVPLFHWGEGRYKVNAAKSEANAIRYQLNDAKEKIELQIYQCTHKVNEANKRLTLALNNLEKANENLLYATLGFSEGVIPISNVLEAQTAWTQAQSAKIDAEIDVKLTEVYLSKALGTIR